VIAIYSILRMGGSRFRGCDWAAGADRSMEAWRRTIWGWYGTDAALGAAAGIVFGVGVGGLGKPTLGAGGAVLVTAPGLTAKR
jgi:hypothetical protein